MRGAALPGESDQHLAAIRKLIKVDRFDITDPAACRKSLAKAKPDYLFHLAAFSSVGQSFAHGEETFRVNVIGTQNILTAFRGRSVKKIIVVSSAEVYGPVRPQEMPLKPDRLFNPVSPYAQSKAAAEYLAHIYADQYGLPIVFARAFNHTGPRQNLNFAIPSFCRKIVEAERHPRNRQISVGNLSARRDISDVRDIVRGYRLLAERGTAGEVYHLCSGRAYRLGDLLEALLLIAERPIKIKKDKSLLRKADIPILQGDFRTTTKITGWKPKIEIERTLTDTLQYWRHKT